MSKRTKLTKEEIRDLFPLETIKVFKKLKCFDKLLDEIMVYTNNIIRCTYDQKVVLLNEIINLEPVSIILRTFYWNDSKYGYKYWNKIYSQLINNN